MRDVSGVRVTGPLAPLAEGFRQELRDQGYSVYPALRHMQLMNHLSRWLAGKRRNLLPLRTSSVEGYLRARRDAGYRSFLTVRSVRPLLEYLRRAGQFQEADHEGDIESDPVEGLLNQFGGYLRTDRGLAEITIERRVYLARRIVSGWHQRGRADLRELTAGDVTAFVLDSCRTADGSVSGMVTALRSLLRFLHGAGVIDRPLAEAVPRLASWKLAGLPQAISAQQVTALLASCDRASVVGRRDAAIVTVLARLGLRAGEVAALRLQDVDWRSGQITVHGKGNRWERLPLPCDVGEAMAAYLTDGHPGTAVCQGRVFARVRAPHGPLTRGAVTQVVARAAVRAGFDPFFARRLRHTAATGMLAGGASLDEIGQVLRHHHRLTTAIYAKVDVEGLRTVARPWPGSRTTVGATS
jgi:site-specific recombinase XerD